MFVLAILRLRRAVMEDIDPQRCLPNHPVTPHAIGGNQAISAAGAVLRRSPPIPGERLNRSPADDAVVSARIAAMAATPG